MKTNHEHFFRDQERGNALIYVLLAIVLFAALSFLLSRQTDTGEASYLSQEKVELYATQLISHATQVRQVIEQMVYSGTDIEELNFVLPSDGTFEDGSDIHKVYHPDGGGLNYKPLPAEAIAQVSATPPAGWYLGVFNNVEWTALGPGNTAGQGGAAAPYTDAILVAYQIPEAICAKINEKLGVSGIPSMTDSIKETMIDDSTAGYGGGANTDLTTDSGDICPDCDNRAMLCVQEGGMYAFYSVVADR